jgi:hypothetical protein
MGSRERLKPPKFSAEGQQKRLYFPVRMKKSVTETIAVPGLDV